MLLTLESDSLLETIRLGAAISGCLQLGDVIALDGDLGAGKTHFVQAVAKGLGVDDEEVTSPTYVIIQEYTGTIPVCHIDAYRLNDVDEFLELGADELVGGDCVSLIEWASKVEEVLPIDRLTVQIRVNSEHGRTFCFSSGGPRSLTLLRSFVQALADTP